jgi:hypothetical protein
MKSVKPINKPTKKRGNNVMNKTTKRRRVI